MKKLTILAACVAAAAAVFSCAKEQSPVSGKTTVLTASIDPTKTVLAENGSSVLWSDNDAISVNGTASSEIVTADGGASASFTFDGELAQPYMAVFPASAWVDATHVALPATQTYAANSFGASASVMAAYTTEGNNLHFMNVMSMMKFTLTSESARTISSVVLAGNNGEQLSGSFAIDYTTLAVENTASATAADKKTTLQGSIAVSEGTVIYIAVPAQAYANGVTLTITDSEGNVMVKAIEKSLTFTAGTIKEFTAPLAFVATPSYEQPSATPEKLYLGGAAAEANSQEMRKDGDKFIIFNKLTEGAITLTDENGTEYFANASGNLYVGDETTAVSASADVTRITVDFSSNTVKYENIDSYIHMKWAATYADPVTLEYAGLGVYSGEGTIVFLGPGRDGTPSWCTWVEERYYFIIQVDGNNTCWGSTYSAAVTPDGTEAFFNIGEYGWDQWSHCWKMDHAFDNQKTRVTIDTKTMTHKYELVVEGDVLALYGTGAEAEGQAFRKESEGVYVIYSRLKAGKLSFKKGSTNYYFDSSNALVSGDGEGDCSASESGCISRITVNTNESTVKFDKINEYTHMKFCCNYLDIAHLKYQGNGIFRATDVTVTFVDPNNSSTNPPSWLSWVEDRYYFITEVNGSNSCWGSLAESDGDNGPHAPDGTATFWEIHESDWNQWLHAWKFASDINGATVDIEVNTNNDGVWNHTITKK